MSRYFRQSVFLCFLYKCSHRLRRFLRMPRAFALLPLFVVTTTMAVPFAQAHGPPEEFVWSVLSSFVYSTVEAGKGNPTPAYVGAPILITGTYATVDEMLRDGESEKEQQDSEDELPNEKEIGAFLHIMGDVLRLEMARGEGENLNALAALWGCPASLQPQFGRMTQHHYPSLDKAVGQAESHHGDYDISAFRDALNGDPTLKAACIVG